MSQVDNAHRNDGKLPASSDISYMEILPAIVIDANNITELRHAAKSPSANEQRSPADVLPENCSPQNTIMLLDETPFNKNDIPATETSRLPHSKHACIYSSNGNASERQTSPTRNAKNENSHPAAEMKKVTFAENGKSARNDLDGPCEKPCEELHCVLAHSQDFQENVSDEILSSIVKVPSDTPSSHQSGLNATVDVVGGPSKSDTLWPPRTKEGAECQSRISHLSQSALGHQEKPIETALPVHTEPVRATRKRVYNKPTTDNEQRSQDARENNAPGPPKRVLTEDQRMSFRLCLCAMDLLKFHTKNEENSRQLQVTLEKRMEPVWKAFLAGSITKTVLLDLLNNLLKNSHSLLSTVDLEKEYESWFTKNKSSRTKNQVPFSGASSCPRGASQQLEGDRKTEILTTEEQKEAKRLCFCALDLLKYRTKHVPNSVQFQEKLKKQMKPLWEAFLAGSIPKKVLSGTISRLLQRCHPLLASVDLAEEYSPRLATQLASRRENIGTATAGEQSTPANRHNVQKTAGLLPAEVISKTISVEEKIVLELALDTNARPVPMNTCSWRSGTAPNASDEIEERNYDELLGLLTPSTQALEALQERKDSLPEKPLPRKSEGVRTDAIERNFMHMEGNIPLDQDLQPAQRVEDNASRQKRTAVAKEQQELKNLCYWAIDLLQRSTKDLEISSELQIVLKNEVQQHWYQWLNKSISKKQFVVKLFRDLENIYPPLSSVSFHNDFKEWAHRKISFRSQCKGPSTSSAPVLQDNSIENDCNSIMASGGIRKPLLPLENSNLPSSSREIEISKQQESELMERKMAIIMAHRISRHGRGFTAEKQRDSTSNPKSLMQGHPRENHAMDFVPEEGDGYSSCMFLKVGTLQKKIQRMLKKNDMQCEFPVNVIESIALAARKRVENLFSSLLKASRIRMEAEKPIWQTTNVGANMFIAMSNMREEEDRNTINFCKLERDDIPMSTTDVKRETTSKKRIAEKRYSSESTRLSNIFQRDALSYAMASIVKKRKKKKVLIKPIRLSPLKTPRAVSELSITPANTSHVLSISRITLRDCLFLFSEDPLTRKSELLYKWYARCCAPHPGQDAER